MNYFMKYSFRAGRHPKVMTLPKAQRYELFCLLAYSVEMGTPGELHQPDAELAEVIDSTPACFQRRLEFWGTLNLARVAEDGRILFHPLLLPDYENLPWYKEFGAETPRSSGAQRTAAWRAKKRSAEPVSERPGDAACDASCDASVTVSERPGDTACDALPQPPSFREKENQNPRELENQTLPDPTPLPAEAGEKKGQAGSGVYKSVVQALRKKRVSQPKAEWIARQVAAGNIAEETVHWQIAWLEYRQATDPPGMLVAAIEGNYPPPVEVIEAQARREEGERLAAERRREAEITANREALVSRLWEGLSPEQQAEIKAALVPKLPPPLQRFRANNKAHPEAEKALKQLIADYLLAQQEKEPDL